MQVVNIHVQYRILPSIPREFIEHNCYLLLQYGIIYKKIFKGQRRLLGGYTIITTIFMVTYLFYVRCLFST